MKSQTKQEQENQLIYQNMENKANPSEVEVKNEEKHSDYYQCEFIKIDPTFNNSTLNSIIYTGKSILPQNQIDQQSMQRQNEYMYQEGMEQEKMPSRCAKEQYSETVELENSDSTSSVNCQKISSAYINSEQNRELRSRQVQEENRSQSISPQSLHYLRRNRSVPQQENSTEEIFTTSELDSARNRKTKEQKDYESVRKNFLKNIWKCLIDYIHDNKEEVQNMLISQNLNHTKFFKKFGKKGARSLTKQQFKKIFFTNEQRQGKTIQKQQFIFQDIIRLQEAEQEKKILRIWAFRFIQHELIPYLMGKSRIKHFSIFISLRHYFVSLISDPLQ